MHVFGIGAHVRIRAAAARVSHGFDRPGACG